MTTTVSVRSPPSRPFFFYCLTNAYRRVPHTYRAGPRRARRGRAWACSPSSRRALFIHLGATDRARGAPGAAVHAWAQVRHRDDSGAHAPRYV